MTRSGPCIRMMRVFGVGVVASLSSAGLAQQAKPTSVQQLVSTPDYQRTIARLFSQLPPDVFQRCPGLVSQGSRVTIIQPVTFAPDGNPVAGLWKQSFPVSGCGNDTVINFFFRAGPDGKIASVTALPGDTHAGVQLQRDAVRFAFIAVQAKAQGCSALHVRTTRYTGSPGEGMKSALERKPEALPWQEVWTVSACGQSYDVPMTFIPDATGTIISTAPAHTTKP